MYDESSKNNVSIEFSGWIESKTKQKVIAFKEKLIKQGSKARKFENKQPWNWKKESMKITLFYCCVVFITRSQTKFGNKNIKIDFHGKRLVAQSTFTICVTDVTIIIIR